MDDYNSMCESFLLQLGQSLWPFLLLLHLPISFHVLFDMTSGWDWDSCSCIEGVTGRKSKEGVEVKLRLSLLERM